MRNTLGVTLFELGVPAGAGAALDWPDLVGLLGLVQDQNYVPSGIIHAPRTERDLANLTDTTGQPRQAPALVAGVPRYPTTQVPVTLAKGGTTPGAGNTSETFVGDWSNVYIGMRVNFIIHVLRERYADTGTIGFLAWMRGDVAVVRPNALAVGYGITPAP